MHSRRYLITRAIVRGIFWATSTVAFLIGGPALASIWTNGQGL